MSNSVPDIVGYLMTVLPALLARIGLSGSRASQMQSLLLAALNASNKQMSCSTKLGMTEPIPECRLLWEEMGNLLVSGESHLINPWHVATALDFARQGGNVLIIQNHTSGADTFVWDTLVDRQFGSKTSSEFAYMAGHVVNIYAIPLMITSALRRFQIYSSSYKRMAEQTGITLEQMAQQNVRACSSLSRYVRKGGKVIGLYPEGGRGNGQLKFGDPETAIIPKLISHASKCGLLILPTYVSGATSILPVVRQPDEFSIFLEHVRPGTATVTCGQPVNWEEIQSTEEEIHNYPGQGDAFKSIVYPRLMGLIANLAPNEHAKGPWAKSKGAENAPDRFDRAYAVR